MKTYLRVYEKLRTAIVRGDFALGARLPSKRQTAANEGVSVITVEHAYEILCAEGYAEARERSGFFAAYRKEDGDDVRALGLIHVPPAKPDRHRRPDKLPFAPFARALRGVVTRWGERLLVKSPNTGTREVRQAIVRYLGRTRGVRVTAAQVVVGSGAEYLYGLLAQMFKGATFAVEDPSYAKIRAVYEAHGRTCIGLRLGPNGIVSADLAKAKADLLHVTPYRSFPSNVTADASKRHEYIRWAHERKAILIEDDFAVETSVSGARSESLFALDGGKRVIYINTFSKTIAPSLRIGYMVLPKDLIARFQETVGFYACTVPVFEQLFLADFLDSGDFERLIRRLRK